ncbi:MAG: substrate-binding domain-containing protein [Clostridia bacterium]
MKKTMKKMMGILLSLVVLSGLTACAVAEYDFKQEITVVSREEGSGTRGAFVELLGVEKKDESGKKVDHTTEEAVITNNTNVMMTTVAGNEGAIGYSSMGSLNDTVKALQVNGVQANAENVKNGSYTVSRPFNIATKSTPSEAAQDFMTYILSAEGQQVVTDNGYIALDNAVSYAGKQVSGKIVIAGSSSVTPVMEKLKEAYAILNPNAEIEIQQSDSTTGMQSTMDGVCDIGMASRALKDSELEAGLVGTVIAMDGIAIIVNPSNPITSMTVEEIAQIFTGETTTWEGFVK